MSNLTITEQWWLIEYTEPLGDEPKTRQTWKGQYGSEERARTAFKGDCPRGHIESIRSSDIEPWSYWVRKDLENPRLPKDCITVTLGSRDGVVEGFTTGGGMGGNIPWDKFEDTYRLVTEEEYKSSRQADLGFFAFDWGPTIVAFHYNTRWNGWGSPYCEKESFRKFVAKTYEPDDECRFEFKDDGTLVWHHGEAYVDEDEDEEVEIPLEVIFYRGSPFQVYNVGMSLTWHQFDPEELPDLAEEERDQCLEAIMPDGLPPSVKKYPPLWDKIKR